MANEITIQSKLTATKGGSSVTNYTSDFTITMASALSLKSSIDQSVGYSAAEAISTGDVTLTQEHWLQFVNNDATNFVTVEVHKDSSNMAVAGVMLPGEPFGPVRALAQGTSPFGAGYPCYKLKADTAACVVTVIACEAGDPTA